MGGLVLSRRRDWGEVARRAEKAARRGSWQAKSLTALVLRSHSSSTRGDAAGDGEADGEGAGAGVGVDCAFLDLTIHTIRPMMMDTSTTANTPSMILVRTSRRDMPAGGMVRLGGERDEDGREGAHQALRRGAR